MLSHWLPGQEICTPLRLSTCDVLELKNRLIAQGYGPENDRPLDYKAVKCLVLTHFHRK
jgi:hypothetical protein